MKKKVFTIISVIIIIIIAATAIYKNTTLTKASSKNANTAENKQKLKKHPQKTKVATNSNALKNSNNTIYAITKSNYNDNNVKIDYPQFTNLNNKNNQDLVNNIIKNEALKALKYYPDQKNKVSLNIKYQVKWQSKDLLSIVYSGDGYVDSAPHPNNLFFTTNIDMNNLSKIKITDAIKIDMNFINNLKKLNSQFASALKDFTDSDLLKEFTNADSLDNIGTETQSDMFCYFTKDSLGISIGVSSSEGDHKEFEFKYKDIESNIKTNNEIWKSLDYTTIK